MKRVRRDYSRVMVLGALLIAGLLWYSTPNPCYIVRTYEVDGLTYCDYVSGDNSFHGVYIEDVPDHVKNGHKDQL